MLGPTVERVYHALGGRTLLHKANAVVVTSRQEADDAIAFGCKAASIRIRRNGVDLSGEAGSATPEDVRGQLGIGPDQPLLRFLGRIDPMKNLSALFAALSGLRAEPWHLAIVGPAEDAAYCETLKDLARSLGLASRMSWLGPRYGPEKRAVVAAADLMLLVSLRENWGNVVQEAMARLFEDLCGQARARETRI